VPSLSLLASSNRQGLTDKLCDLAEKHPLAAETIAKLLGYPGVGAAASAVCSLRSSG
jgi:hypothetical protein